MLPIRSAVHSHVAIVICVLALTVATASAQQINGVPGSPNATTTIDGKQLPPPNPEFGGVIKEKAAEATPLVPPRIVPPQGGPNILLILTYHEGFGAPSTFRGVIDTPALDCTTNMRLRDTPSRP